MDLNQKNQICQDLELNQAEPDSTQDPDFIVPSSSGVKSTAIRTKTQSLTLNLPRNPFKSKIISTMGDRVNLSAGQQTAFMGAIL